MVMLRKKILLAVILLLALAISAIYFCDAAICSSAKGKLYSDVQSIPYNRAGVLLGTSKYLGGGCPNPYYDNRIEAAAELLKAGKIKYIIVSGDNSRKEYNEPVQMKEDLIKAGADSSRIYLDYAGFRTFDSMVRAKEIFGLDSVTVISQQFHNERAVYIGEHEGIYTIGFNAKDVSSRIGFKVEVREKFARVKVFLDYLFGKEPKFLGEKIIIPS